MLLRWSGGLYSLGPSTGPCKYGLIPQVAYKLDTQKCTHSVQRDKSGPTIKMVLK